jgi:hypothetical protein
VAARAPSVSKNSKAFRESAQFRLCADWADEQNGPPGPPDDKGVRKPCQSPPWATSSESIPYGSVGICAGLTSAWRGRNEQGEPEVGLLQLAFVCLRIRRRLENLGENRDAGCTPRDLLMTEVAAVRGVLAKHKPRGPVGFSIVGE